VVAPPPCACIGCRAVAVVARPAARLGFDPGGPDHPDSGRRLCFRRRRRRRRATWLALDEAVIPWR
jgi:hypothetical protein